MSPVRIQRKRTKGWRMPEGAVYVGRPSAWGNPFPVGYEGDLQPWLALALGFRGDEAGRRSAAVVAFAWWMSGMETPFPVKGATPGPGDLEYSDGTTRHIADVPAAMGVMMLGRQPINLPTRPDLAPLRGRDLACFCAPDEPCHADVLLELANR